jgi:hypothetical protein
VAKGKSIPVSLRVRAYSCWPKQRPDWATTIHAFTPSAARCEAWRGIREAWDGIKYTDMRSRFIGAPVTDDDFRRVAESRGVPFARVGMGVIVDGKPGVLVGANDSANFDVMFEGGRVGNCHPNWNMEYLREAQS